MEKAKTIEDIDEKLQLILSAVITNKAVLNLTEAAAYANVAVSYMYKLTSLNEVPHSKPRGKMLYFQRSELDKWLLQNPVKSNQEIEQAANNHVSGVA